MFENIIGAIALWQTCRKPGGGKLFEFKCDYLCPYVLGLQRKQRESIRFNMLEHYTSGANTR